MAKQLTVYKASAGSGKTFTLAVEYISLLIDNPQKYKNILAVTFTNKATEEMKERILSQLYGIWKGLPDSDNYIEKIKEHLPDYSENLIRERAGIALHLLIHHYHYFRIETIDSFFQSVLRNLAKELNLTANLHVSLDDEQIEGQAVDEIIESFAPNDPMLLWLIKYIEDTIDEDRSWNVIKSLKKMGMNIFKDYYKKHSKALHAAMQETSFKGYVSMLKEIKDDAKKQAGKYADQFFETLEKNGLTKDDFNSRSTVFTYFKKIKDCNFSDKECKKEALLKCCDDPEAWVKKKQSNREEVINAVTTTLLPLLREIEGKRSRLWRDYISSVAILDNINEVRLLHRIEEKVQELNHEVNRFLLSDTQQLLQSLMKDSDTPFVFEKIGSQLTHVMIDEFQDTSNVQWDNFKILLNETMSHAVIDESNKLVNNLIVGDVKQSIYRWRNSDWQLLNDIEHQFPKGKDTVYIQPLDTNYRSNTNIISFNNLFFKEAARQEANTIETLYNYPTGAQSLRTAYDKVDQKKKEPDKKEGYVNIQLFKTKDFTELSMCENVGEQVDHLLSMGIPQKDIAILVRAKKYIPMIADYFMLTRPDVHLISEEAFQLQSSLTIATLMDALRLMINPQSELFKENIKSTCRKIGANVDVDGLFADMQNYRHLSLIDLLEQMFTLLHLSLIPQESAFLFKLFDEVMKFTRDNGTDIERFIEEWDEQLYKKAIQTTLVDGIQIVSIHKSKGLEYKHLIIPFCDWKLEMNDSVWFEPTAPPYNIMPIVPVDFKDSLRESVFREAYLHEHLQNIVDNLNLLYVAFTRAKNSLFVMGRVMTKAFRSTLIENVLPVVSEQLENACYESNDERVIFEYGNISHKEKMKKKDENVFTVDPVDVMLDIHPCHHQVDFKQSNKSKEFLSGNETSQENTYIKIGKVLHYLFSKIHTLDDVPMVLKELEQDGILYDEDISVGKLQRMLDDRLHDPRVVSWFSPRWTLYNECTILEAGKENRRPDRVMIDGDEVVVVDFKFGKFNNAYIQQVAEYKSLLRKMGYTKVTGYLWMVYTNKIVEV